MVEFNVEVSIVKTFFGGALSLALFVAFAMPFTARAEHTWGDYHFGRTGDHPFVLKLGDNVSGSWDQGGHLGIASYDWSLSAVLSTTVVAGSTNPKRCNGKNGKVEVCSSRYGNTGWLGIAQIWISGSLITQGVVKLNDNYFDTPSYDTPAWRNLVMCQEVGHTFGLAHQDENFDNPNLDSCMDYTSNPESNQHPNPHDYDLLAQIYDHYDNVDTFDYSDDAPTEDDPPACRGGWKKCGSANVTPGINDLVLNQPSQWGRLVASSRSDRQAVYDLDLGDGHRILTHVFWADEHDHG